MLSREENEYVTSTGKGMPMGELFRRFWIPGLLSDEILEPDCPPVEVNLLGECLIAFRKTDGKAVVMDKRCPHRHANLLWGRNEENGIRCVYHGWKFGGDGRCLEMPAEPEKSKFHERVRVASYATHECAGIVWVYMGPEELRPPFPRFEFSVLPAENTLSGKRRVACNYLQNLEGEMDTAHNNFLHHEFGDGPKILPKYMTRTPFLISKTEFGLIAIARREYPHEEYYWRMTPFMLPCYTIIPSGPEFKTLTAAVPLDDENMWGFSISWRPERAMDTEDRETFFSGDHQQVLVDTETFRPLLNRGNKYGIDRSRQKSGSFTGIRGIRQQDIAVQEDQDGPNLRRWEEHLGTTDRAIVATRRRLIELARELEGGQEPIEARRSEAYLVRSVVGESGRSVDWRAIWDDGQPAGAVFDHIAHAR